MENSALMASEDDRIEEIEKNVSGFENSRQNGRRKPKSNESPALNKKKKKLPRRGMGVAQLERLRLTPQNPLQSPILHSHYFLPTLYSDQTPSIDGGYGQLSPNHSFVLPRLGNGGLCPENGFTVSDRYLVDRYVFKEANPGLPGGNYLGETSKELSSIPNSIRYPSGDYCSICNKKRVNGGSFGCNEMREKYVEPSPINLCGFFGVNVGNKQHIHGINVDKGSVEVLGVHRKGSSSVAVMEYDFFSPEKGGRGTSTEEMNLSLFSGEASVAVLGGGYIDHQHQGSCVTTTTTTSKIFTTGFESDASTNSVDLSLKLSY